MLQVDKCTYRDKNGVEELRYVANGMKLHFIVEAIIGNEGLYDEVFNDLYEAIQCLIRHSIGLPNDKRPHLKVETSDSTQWGDEGNEWESELVRTETSWFLGEFSMEDLLSTFSQCSDKGE